MSAHSNDTPIMQQYKEVKSRYKDALLLFRMGDFYETFYDDAHKLSKETGIVLTAREYRNKKIPMAGIPVKSADTYIKKLVERGYKIAICEQLENPSKGKKIVKRDVVEVLSPGNVLRPHLIDEKSNNFIMGLKKSQKGNIIAVLMDISTGEIIYTYFNELELEDILEKFKPKEIIKQESFDLNSSLFTTSLKDYLFEDNSGEFIKERLNITTLSVYGLDVNTEVIGLITALWQYLETQHNMQFNHFSVIKRYSMDDTLNIDKSTLRNLEVFSTIHGEKEGSLLSVIDTTITPMGGRFIKNVFSTIPIMMDEINARLDAVEELTQNGLLLKEIRNLLENIGDINRISVRIDSNKAHPKEILMLKYSLEKSNEILEKILSLNKGWWADIKNNIRISDDVIKTIEKTIKEDAPSRIDAGGIIKDGFNKEIDELRYILGSTKEWLENFQEREKNKTGITNLKVGFNSVFGYYIEVSKSNIDKVPDNYIRKQTLRNAERFITKELKEMEEKILTAEEKLIYKENELFNNLREYLRQYTERIRIVGESIAKTDFLCSMAFNSLEKNYVRPIIHENYELIIESGRHPVVENYTEEFIPNDTNMRSNKNTIILTGPNMSGKSTYLRQNAIIILLAHIGSFVPASYAKIPLTDRVFTRIGASDDISTGVSTFMMEMVETAYILRNATEKSFIILDEIGRGTSTYDGMSIARAVLIYIIDKIKAKTMFATHYHELTDMENKYESVINMQIMVKEWGNSVVFLKKVIKGKADKSYGIEVAELAGLPKDVVDNAKQILANVDAVDIKGTEKENRTYVQMPLLEFHKSSEIEKEILHINLNELKPIEALNKIYEWKKFLEGKN